MADRDWAEERVDVVCKGWALAKRSKAKIATALRQAREEGRPKWQTIDTAPRDGTEIQVCGEDGVVQNAYWESCVWFEGWCCGGHRSDMYGPTCPPTHWLPKATPPGADK